MTTCEYDDGKKITEDVRVNCEVVGVVLVLVPNRVVVEQRHEHGTQPFNRKMMVIRALAQGQSHYLVMNKPVTLIVKVLMRQIGVHARPLVVVENNIKNLK